MASNIEDERYIRVGTTLYKIVRKPLQSGDFYEIRISWNYDTLKQDHNKEFITQIKKYDGFCCLPDHVNYKRTIGTFLNEYEPIDVTPSQGVFPSITTFLHHIFGEQYEMGLDYLQLLYTRPLQRLPILLLVSKERNTGKTTLLNLLKAIFGANMTFNTNDDFRSQFNSDWATKLIVAVDEVLLDRKEDSERIKNLSTARSYKAESKGKDRNEVEFFAKFVLCSNNELNPIQIEQGETRYWVRRVPTIEGGDNVNLLGEMKKELPAFLWFLLRRQLSTRNETRMWFRADLLVNDALRKIINHNRNKTESEMLHIITEIMEIERLDEFVFCIGDMAYMLEVRGLRCEHNHLRKILQQNWELRPNEPRYYTSYRLLYDGTIDQSPRTGRCYVITRQRLNEILLLC